MFSFTMYSPGMFSLAPGSIQFVGMAINVFGSGLFWLAMILTVAICLLPIIGYRWVNCKLNPTFSDLIRKGVWKERRKHAESLVSFSIIIICTSYAMQKLLKVIALSN